MMQQMNYVFLYLGALASFLALDLLWLGLIAKNFYRENLKHLIADDFNRLAAGIFYLLFVLGILIFAVLPALRDGDGGKALLFGALFGFFTYVTYDLTNLATLRDWPLKVTIVDIVWGTILAGSVAVTSYGIGRWLGL